MTHYERSTFDSASLFSSGLYFSFRVSSHRCSSKKQTVLCTLPVTESYLDTGIGSSGAFNFLVRTVCHPHYHGGSHLSSAPQFLLTACLLSALPSLKGPSRAKGGLFCLLTCSSFIVPSLPHLPVAFKVLFKFILFALFSSSQWCCTIVYSVCKELFTHLIGHCVPLFNWHQPESRQPRQLWILQSLNNSSKAFAQVIQGSACLFLYITYLHHVTPPAV